MMLKALLKKQLLESFTQFFRSNKSGNRRKKSGIVGYTIMFAVLILFLASAFFGMAVMLCPSLVKAEMGWLYHALMCLVAVMLGVFGSVFNTYSSLYMAKDNELLLSLPIPERRILAVRLSGVWFWGLFYSSIVLIPSVIVYCMSTGFRPRIIIADILLIFFLSIFVLAFSCILGWIVAKINGKIKSKSFVTVAVSVAFFGVYYYICFKASSLIEFLLANAAAMGEKIRGTAYPLYLVGRVGEGDLVSLLIFAAAVLVVSALIWRTLSRSFLKLATSQNGTKKVQYREKNVKQKSASGALLTKELKRFTASSTYMLNCGMGSLFLVAAAVAILILGRDFMLSIPLDLDAAEKIFPLIVCALICTISSMNDITAPSVSLEGKSVWLAQSLPISPWQALEAKLKLHLLLTEIPVAFCSVCAVIVLKSGVLTSLMLIVVPMLFVLSSACIGLIINLKSPNLNWTNETTVVKQSMGVMISLFGGWIVIALLTAAYAMLAQLISAEIFLLICAVVFAAGSALEIRWLKTKGSAIFANL